MKGCRFVFQAEAFNGLLEFIAEDGIVITDDIFGRFVESKGFPKLLNRPLGMRPGTDAKMQDFYKLGRQNPTLTIGWPFVQRFRPFRSPAGHI